jgi:hypothetical protein
MEKTMKKLLLLLFVCIGLSVFAQAKPQPYYFSNELKNAVSNCKPYTEELFKKNPDMQEQTGGMISMFFDKFDTSSIKLFMEVKGKKGNKCQINLKYDYQIAKQEFNCSLSAEEQTKLLTAMNDKSTEVKKKTIKSGFMTTTTSGREFDLTLTEITSNSCKEIENNPSEEEQKEMANKMLAFSDKFKKSLATCTPDKDTIKVMGMDVGEAEIKGRQNGKCHLTSKGFHVFLNDDELNLSGFDKLTELLSDEKRATYHPVYRYKETLFALDNCTKNKNVDYPSSNESLTLGENIEISKSLSASYQNGSCQIVSSLIVKRNGKTKDYSLRCEVKEQDIAQYTGPYSNLIKQYGPKISANSFSSGQQTEAVSKADKEILTKMIKDGMCKRTN